MKRKLTAFLISCMAIAFGAAGFMTARAQTPVQEMSVVDVNFTNYAGWAGECIAVNLGVPLGADWTDLTSTHGSYVSLENENGVAYSVDLIDVQNTYLLINRGKGYTPTFGDVLTLKEGLQINGYELAKDTTYVYETENQPWVYRSDTPLTVVPLTVMQTQEQDNVYYSFDWGKETFGTCVVVGFNKNNWDGDIATFADISSYNREYVVLTDGYGNALELNDITYVNNGNFLIRSKTAAQKLYAGGTIELKAGFSVRVGQVAATLSDDIKYICKGEMSHQMPAFNANMIPTSISILNGDEDKEVAVSETLQIRWAIPEGTYGSPVFTLSDTTKATVDETGLITGIAVGETVLTVSVAGHSATFSLNIVPEREVIGVELVNTYTYYVLKGDTAVLPTLYARAVFEGGGGSREFLLIDGENATFPTVDTSTVGQKTISIEVLYKGESYSADYLVEVYEVNVDLEVYTVAVVDWFDYCIFVQYPNSSENIANITNTAYLSDVINRITYKRADGTVVEPKFYYVLSHVIAIFYFDNLNINNYNQYYLAGDTITLEAGLVGWRWTGRLKTEGSDKDAIEEGTGMFIKESILRQTEQYRYDGNTWSFYKEYTDFIAESDSQSVGIGKTIRVAVSRVPSDATSGTITYVSSNPSVATVSATGVIQGIKEGSATITATISGGEGGEISRQITVNVFDYITGLEFEEESLNFKVGDTFDASSLNARYVWASGKEGEAADLSDATVSGLDLTKPGSGYIVISVEKDGATISGRIQATVSEKGSSCASCGSVIHGAPFAGIAIFAMLLFAWRRLSKKKRT